MNDYYVLSDSEVIELRNDFKQATEKLRVLLDEDVWYNVPSGLSREEKRMFINEVGKPKYLLTKEQVRKIGEHSLRKYAETSPSDFKVEDFIDLTNVQKESEVNYD